MNVVPEQWIPFIPVHRDEDTRSIQLQSGTRLTAAFNRTRWRDGRVVVWLNTHRGEGSSRLRFDTLVDTPTEPQ